MPYRDRKTGKLYSDEQVEQLLVQGPESTFTPTVVSGVPVENTLEPERVFEPEALLPTAGAMVGGTMAGIPGALAGGFLGEEARIAAQVARGQPSPTPLEILGKAGRTGLETGATEALGRGIFSGVLAPVGRALAGRFARGVAPAIAATTRMAEREGINLPLGARTESPALIGAEAGLARTAGGGSLAAQRRAAETGLQNFAERFADKFGKPISKMEAGIGIKTSFEEAIKKKNELSSQLYDKLSETVGHVPATPESSTNSFIRKFMSERGVSITPGTPPRLATTGDPAEFNFLRNVMRDIQKEDLTYNDLKTIRTLVGDRADFEAIKGTPFQGAYKRIYGALTDDMDKTASAAGFKEISDEARQFYRQFMDFVEKPVAKTINRSNPDGLLDYIVRTNNPTTVKDIMTEFDETGKNAIRRGFLDKIFDNAVDETRPGFKISAPKLARQLNKYDDDVIQELFGKDRKVFDEIRQIGNAMLRGDDTPLSDIYAVIKVGTWGLIAKTGVAKMLEKESVKRLLTEGTPVEVPGVRRGVALAVQAGRTPFEINRQLEEHKEVQENQ